MALETSRVEDIDRHIVAARCAMGTEATSRRAYRVILLANVDPVVDSNAGYVRCVSTGNSCEC